jgi:tRNA modification GTPase
MRNDTIVAISTPLGEGAISIVRMSGQDSIDIANSIYRSKNLNLVDSHTINYGHIIEDNNIIDEVMVSVLKAPKTFTRENMIEINCHGGIAATNKILELCLVKGARLAEPGEFTKRAFLNGRIDLPQAEAVMDLIHAKTEASRELAISGVDGRVSGLIRTLRQTVLETIATIEVNIDYPEYDDVEQMTNEILKPKSEAVLLEINKILNTANDGQVIRDGIKTAIIGRPNVGKSSLLNKLMREEKAIVTDIAGTTRDTVEGFVTVGGITLNLIDTAGIRKTDDLVEQIGVEKSIKMLEDAQLVLLVLNNNDALTKDDMQLLEKSKDKNTIVIINKIDLESKLDRSKIDAFEVVETSMLDNHGIEHLEDAIKHLFNIGTIAPNDFTYVSNARHIALLKQAKQSLIESIESMEMNMPVDMVEIDLKNSWQLLGEILGLEVHEDLINQLFTQFCLGK